MTEAAKWFRKAADQGDAEAQLNLGKSYFSRMGVPGDTKEAVKWYRKAALQGDAEAQSLLGRAYKMGCGGSKDYKEAVTWFRLTWGGLNSLPRPAWNSVTSCSVNFKTNP